MKKIIFWYWSLLTASWWNSTLKREIKDEDLIYLELDWYKRVWTPTIEIKFENKKTSYNWVFLDIKKCNKCFVNWYWVEVLDNEFDMISKRELAYEMIDVTNNIKNKKPWYQYYTAFIKLKNKNICYESDDSYIIPKKYHDKIMNVLDTQTKEFKTNYLKNTSKPSYKLLDWFYNFCNPLIDYYTWHSNNKTDIK